MLREIIFRYFDIRVFKLLLNSIEKKKNTRNVLFFLEVNLKFKNLKYIPKEQFILYFSVYT